MFVTKEESGDQLTHDLLRSTPYFTHEEIGTQKRQVTCPKLPSESAAELRLELNPQERPLLS